MLDARVKSTFENEFSTGEWRQWKPQNGLGNSERSFNFILVYYAMKYPEKIVLVSISKQFFFFHSPKVNLFPTCRNLWAFSLRIFESFALKHFLHSDLPKNMCRKVLHNTCCTHEVLSWRSLAIQIIFVAKQLLHSPNCKAIKLRALIVSDDFWCDGDTKLWWSISIPVFCGCICVESLVEKKFLFCWMGGMWGWCVGGIKKV